MVDIIQRQFEPCWRMLEETINNWPEDLWETTDPEEPPAWQVALHILMGMEYWMQPEAGKYKAPKFDKEINPNLGEPSVESLSREEMNAYFRKVQTTVDAFFSKLSDQALKEPASAYDQWTNLDVIIENIRHAQHHLGQLNARLRRIGHLPVEWMYFKPA